MFQNRRRFANHWGKKAFQESFHCIRATSHVRYSSREIYGNDHEKNRNDSL